MYSLDAVSSLAASSLFFSLCLRELSSFKTPFFAGRHWDLLLVLIFRGKRELWKENYFGNRYYSSGFVRLVQWKHIVLLGYRQFLKCIDFMKVMFKNKSQCVFQSASKLLNTYLLLFRYSLHCETNVTLCEHCKFCYPLHPAKPEQC